MDRYICLSSARWKLNHPYQFIIGGSVIGSNYRCDSLPIQRADWHWVATEQHYQLCKALLCRLTLFIAIKLSLISLDIRDGRGIPHTYILTSYLNFVYNTFLIRQNTWWMNLSSVRQTKQTDINNTTSIKRLSNMEILFHPNCIVLLVT